MRIITTEKDYIKVPNYLRKNYFRYRIRDLEDKLVKFIEL